VQAGAVMRSDFLALLRGLARSPLFTLVSVLTLGIALGGTAAISTFVRGILLAPLPYRDPDRIVSITRGNEALGFHGMQIWGPDLALVIASSRSFSQISAFKPEDLNLRGGAGPEKVRAAIMPSDLFTLLGIEAASGRTFLPGETEGAAILSHRLWMSRFGGAPETVGSTLRHDRGVSTIVGILPPGIEIPLKTVEVLLPMDPALMRSEDSGWYEVIARLAPETSIATARAELSAVSRRQEEEQNPPVKGWGFEVDDLRAQIVGGVAPTVWMLQAAVLLVLLVACANFAGLLLARGILREKEIAVRRAIGARRSAIARVFLGESLILAIAGGFLGLLLAHWLAASFLALAPKDLPRSGEVAVDGAVLAAGIALAILTGILAGLVPAVVFSSPNPTRASAASASRLRSAFTIVQLAAALTLSIGCGLLAKSLVRLVTVDLGFEPSGLLSLDVSLPYDRYPEAPQQTAAFQSLLERLESVPDARAVGAVPWTLMTGSASHAQMSTEDVSGTARERDRWPLVLGVSPGFFRTVGIPLVSGRGFEEVESSSVVIVNRRLAERAWPGESAVGRRIKFGRAESENPWFEIVGVVETARLVGLAMGEEEAMFQPLLPLDYSYGALVFLIRTRSDPMDAVPSIRAAVSDVDPEIPLSRVRAMTEAIAEDARSPRFRLAIVASFTALAVGLASLGIYGVVAQWTAARRREIGVRMALGADRHSVIRLVVEQGAVLAALGALLGVLGSLAAARFLESFLYEVSSFDPLTLVLAVVVFSAMALAAALIPARRAASLDPVEALRAE
jgi:predicted permease